MGVEKEKLDMDRLGQLSTQKWLEMHAKLYERKPSENKGNRGPKSVVGCKTRKSGSRSFVT